MNKWYRLCWTVDIAQHWSTTKRRPKRWRLFYLSQLEHLQRCPSLRLLFHKITNYSPLSWLWCIICSTYQVFGMPFTSFPPASPLSIWSLLIRMFKVASTKVTDSLPYEVFTGIVKNNINYFGIYSDQPRISLTHRTFSWQLPLNERDVDDPDIIFVHPQSSFTLTLKMTTSRFHTHLFLTTSASLPALHFSTRSVSMIATILDPPGICRAWHYAGYLKFSPTL